ncbi:hypothetical protein ES703_48396 [subsurface metagenome]
MRTLGQGVEASQENYPVALELNPHRFGPQGGEDVQYPSPLRELSRLGQECFALKSVICQPVQGFLKFHLA